MRSLRAKTVLLLVLLTLVPVLGTVLLLVSANTRPVLDAEEMLQSAVVNEVAEEPMRPLHEVTRDLQAVAAVLARAAEGQIRDDDAILAARALVGDRETIDAVRFEVPAAHVSSVIRWRDSADAVPASTPELRAEADRKGIAVAVSGAARGTVVAPIPKGPASKSNAPAGYVTTRADLGKVAAVLDDIGKRRFVGAVSLVVATADRRVVAAYGVPNVNVGESITDLPLWSMLPTNAVATKRFSVNGRFVDGGVAMVGAIQTVPENGWLVASFRPESVAYAALTEMRTRGLIVAGVAALLAILVGFAAAGGITAPILRVVGQTRLIARREWGKLALASTRRDEIGELTRSLGEMAVHLEEGEKEAKLRADLSRFMSKPLVDAIVKGEHSLSLGGKRADVSIVFADVVGFTPLAEARDAAVMVGLLNELFSMLTEIVFRHGGTVDKFIGDCIMAVWGAPVPQPDHAVRALRAAEDMMRFLETANEAWRDKYDVEIRLGIGVNSGEALVGNIGSDKRMEYTVIGDVVNVAARLEAIAQPNQVLVAGATADLAGDAFTLEKLGDRRLTGRKTETTVYALEIE